MMSEHDEQAALFDWARDMERFMPALALLHCIPNGMFIAGNPRRRRGIMNKMKREGLKPGVPDVFLPIPRGKFPGFYIEMKVGRNKPTDNQNQWLVALLEQGYRVDVCYGADDAIRAICDYLGIEDRFI